MLLRYSLAASIFLDWRENLSVHLPMLYASQKHSHKIAISARRPILGSSSILVNRVSIGVAFLRRRQTQLVGVSSEYGAA
jgi:hypothetical protein